jgi:Mce-associated membrane protein
MSSQDVAEVDTTMDVEPIERDRSGAETIGGEAESKPADVDAAPEDADDPSTAEHSGGDRPTKRRPRCGMIVAFGVIPALIGLLAMAAGFLKWQVGTAHEAQLAGISSVQAATDGTVALLSYKPETVDEQLKAATVNLTGSFRDSYGALIHDVVIPGAKQQHISAVATVPLASSVSATTTHAVALLYVDQTTTIGAGAPTATASSVRVTLEKVGDRWLISAFEPI